MTEIRLSKILQIMGYEERVFVLIKKVFDVNKEEFILLQLTKAFAQPWEYNDFCTILYDDLVEEGIPEEDIKLHVTALIPNTQLNKKIKTMKLKKIKNVDDEINYKIKLPRICFSEDSWNGRNCFQKSDLNNCLNNVVFVCDMEGNVLYIPQKENSQNKLINQTIQDMESIPLTIRSLDSLDQNTFWCDECW